MILEKKHTCVDEWIVRATQQIKFAPDRRAVSTELQEHIEDKLLDLRRLYPDITPEAAAQRALNQMGDAEEIGRELANIHTPWLGYLWRLSQMVLGVTMLVTSIFFLNHVIGGGNGWFRLGSKIEPSQYEANCVYRDLDMYCEPACVDGYRVTVEQVTWVEREDRYYDLAILMRTMSPYFWDREGRTVCEQMQAMDSLGNIYYPYESILYGEHPVDLYPDEMGYIHGILNGYGPFYQDYILWVNNIAPDAQWLRLEYDWLGRAFSIPIGLKEGRA